MKQKINPLVAVVVIVAVLAGAGWLIYDSTQPRMVDSPYKTPEQRGTEARQMAQGMRAGISAMAKAQKAKSATQAASEPKRDSPSGNTPQPEKGEQKQ